jgi:DNA-binding NarL/FixJ family response regulator
MKKEVEAGFTRSVLVVEDDSFMRSLICKYLIQAGFEVSGAANVSEARKQLKVFDPDAIILDIDLGPGPSGLDFAIALDKSDYSVAIVFLTNYSDPRFAGYDLASTHPNAAYLNKHMMQDASVILEALEIVLQDKSSLEFRFDKRNDRPFAKLSSSQIETLRLIAEGKTNQQIASIRKRSLPGTESLISRTLANLGLNSNIDINSRVIAATQFIQQVGPPLTKRDKNAQ